MIANRYDDNGLIWKCKIKCNTNNHNCLNKNGKCICDHNRTGKDCQQSFYFLINL